MEKVAAGKTLPIYNNEPPFHPSESYPELASIPLSSVENYPYQLFRTLLFDLGLDKDNFGTPYWNPLSEYISEASKVVINPNFVLSYHALNEDIFSIITHPSIIRAIVDYTYIALKGSGEIIIADAPQMDCNWKDLMEIQRIDTIQQFYKETFNFDIQCYDLRNFELIDNRKKAYFENRRMLRGDPLGSVIINLGKSSEFYGLPFENYYGADLNRDETIKHHHNEIHEYCVSRTILNADTVISVPKMKVHKKVGVTLNIKGLVGINTNKNYLVHYRVGTPSQGGDQLPDGRPKYDSALIKAQRFLYDKALAKMSKTGDFIYKSALFMYNTFLKPFKKVSDSTITVDSGNWHGNDSAWRMAADLAKIIYYADKNGEIQNSIQRKVFCVIDGIIGGEDAGPLIPQPKESACIVVGKNPFAVDLVTSRLMNFDIEKIKQFNILSNQNWDFGIRTINDIEIIFNKQSIDGKVFFAKSNSESYFNYKAHPGWIGAIEFKKTDSD